MAVTLGKSFHLCTLAGKQCSWLRIGVWFNSLQAWKTEETDRSELLTGVGFRCTEKETWAPSYKWVASAYQIILALCLLMFFLFTLFTKVEKKPSRTLLTIVTILWNYFTLWPWYYNTISLFSPQPHLIYQPLISNAGRLLFVKAQAISEWSDYCHC